MVRAAHGHGICLLEHGEPHDPCPVVGCAGELRFAHRGGLSSVVCSAQPQQHSRLSPWGEDDLWWRQREQKSLYDDAVAFMTVMGTSTEG